MKKIIFSIIVCACFITLIASMILPVAAVNKESRSVDSTSNQLSALDLEQLDVTDSYYYDRISERAQWCYNWLKDYYDNFSGEPGEYKFDLTHLLPGGSSENEYYQFFLDFIIGDSALKADKPLYELIGRFSGGSWNPSGDNGQIVFKIDMMHLNLSTDDSKQQADARIQQLVDTFDGSDRYTKLYKMTHYLMYNSFYDPYLDQINLVGTEDALASRGIYYNTSVYGYLLKNIAICDGYSDTVKVLCDELDIPCIIIGNKAHAWNLIQMENGLWYAHDITRISKLGWDGSTYNFEKYFEEVFLNPQNTFGANYDDPYMISVPDREPIRDFPVLAKEQYIYTGETVDFSYTLAESTYVPKKGVFSYSVNKDGNTCTITNFEGKQMGDLIIPETLDGYTVTAIKDFAFYYCTGFTGKLVIPDTVEKIGVASFAGCYNLMEIDLPQNLRHIGLGAFIGCKGISNVVFPDLLNTIDEYGFYDCDGLDEISFGRHILSVSDSAFAEIDSDLVIGAPTKSVAQEYALTHNISFESNGSLCLFVDVDGDWEFNDDGHFHTCEHNGRFDIEAHTNQGNYGGCGTVCSVCDAQKCFQKGVFKEDVGVCVNYRPATCNVPAYSGDIWCMCGSQIFSWGEYIGEPTGLHTSATGEWEYNDFQHWQRCKCGNSFQDAMHYGGVATATQRAICDVCGVEYGELLHDHISIGIYSDEYNHYGICFCGEKCDIEAHFGGTATEDNLALCSVCGVAYGDFAEHIHTASYQESDEYNHYKVCFCGENFDIEAHCGGTATDSELALCSVCGVAYGDFAEHVHTGARHESDKYNHYWVCSCGEKLDIEAHYGGTATDQKPAVCELCGTAYGDGEDNTLDNGTELPKSNTEDFEEASDEFVTGCGSTVGISFIGFIPALLAVCIVIKKKTSYTQ